MAGTLCRCLCRSLVLLLSLAVSAQSLADRMLPAAVSAMQKALADDAEAASVAAGQRALQDFLDALDTAPERKLVAGTLAALRDPGGVPVLVPNDVAGKLLAEVAKQRTRGHPERLLPALLLLESRDPRDPRVLFGLAQAYGVASPVCDAGRSANLVGQLLDGLRGGGDAGSDPAANHALLEGFLPELAVTKLLSQREQGEAKVWLRRELLGLRDTLQQGEKISAWPLAEPRLIDLQGLLVSARRKLQQNRCHEVLSAMLTIQPDNLVLQLAMAELHASHGPCEDRSAALRGMDAFLAATEPNLLASDDAPFPRAAIQRDLTRFRLSSNKIWLDAQRELVVAQRERLSDRKAAALWLCPDRKQVDKRRRKIAPAVKRAKGKRAKLAKSLRRNEANLAKLRRIAANPGEKGTRIREFRVQIAKQKKRLAKMDDEMRGQVEELESLDTLLAIAKK